MQVDRQFVVPEFLILTIMDRFLLDKYEKLNHCYFLTDHCIAPFVNKLSLLLRKILPVLAHLKDGLGVKG